jgi:outer membrane receptor protein involved in Fe transport
MLAALAVPAGFAQQAPASSPSSEPKEEEPIMLSPFTVDASKDIGYYAENTLAGSRIRTNISDLGSSITVVTKQQMVDTSSVGINDVFMYEANTEGANTYTQTDVSRNGVPRDTIAGYSSDGGVVSGPSNANRVRGLAAPDLAQNNYPAISRIPFDAYNTNTLEISRGPNSLLFGTGSPAGIVNQSTAQAVLNKRQTTVEARVGSWDAQRFSFSHNQPILNDEVAIYLAYLHDEAGFRRKPSFDVTNRKYIAITLQPFKKTKITASFEKFDNNNNRPNFQTPRDLVTPWRVAGRPSYDPTTRMITILDSGEVKGPYVTDTRSPGYRAGMIAGNAQLSQAPTATVPNPYYIPGIQFGPGGSTRPVVFMDRGNYLYATSPIGGFQTAFTPAPPFSTDYVRPALTALTPAQWQMADRRLTSSAGPVAPAGYGGWVPPATTAKAIYDYESINLLQMNYGMQDAKTYNIELQQEILPNLFLSAGWFRQVLDEDDNYTVSNANAITTLYVDTNAKNMDGSTNTHFGNPYLLDIAPDKFKTPEINNNLRALITYELDLTKKSNWMRWLGRHRFVGLWSDQEDTQSTFRYRMTFDGNDLRYQANPTAANAIVANANFSRIFYVGDNQQGTVTYAPGLPKQPNDHGPSTVSVNTYNWARSAWETSTLHMSQQLFYAGAYGPVKKNLSGKSIALSSYFWDDRIVATAGWRRDDYKARQTNVSGLTTTNTGLSTDLYVNGLAIDPAWTYSRLTNWFRLTGETRTTGIVVKPLRWKGGELQFHFNQSDNFNPPNGIPVDFFGTPLPKSTGDGKDYGIGVSLFDNKLVARVNWYDSTNENALATAAGTAIGRVERMDTQAFRSWADYVVRIRHGQNYLDSNFANNTLYPLTQGMKDEIAALMHVPAYDNWPPSGKNGTQTNKSKGVEFQLIYNPKNNWNIKLTAAQVKATYQDVAPEIDAWLNGDSGRLAIWQNATATDMPEVFNRGDSTGTPVSLRSFWNGYGFNSDVRLSNATGANPSWTSVKGFYEAAVKSEIDVAKALQGKTVTNEREWSASIISNYAFQHGWLDGFGVGGALRWADEAIAGYYGNANLRDSSGNIVAADLTRPITTPSETHLDLWLSYGRKIMKNKVMMRIQFNVRDALEDGRLLPIAYNLDGSAYAYRIVDPRQFFLTTSFTF